MSASIRLRITMKGCPMNNVTLLSIEQASQKLGIGKTLLYREIKDGRIKALKCGRRTLIPLPALESWIDKLPQAEEQK